MTDTADRSQTPAGLRGLLRAGRTLCRSTRRRLHPVHHVHRRRCHHRRRERVPSFVCRIGNKTRSLCQCPSDHHARDVAWEPREGRCPRPFRINERARWIHGGAARWNSGEPHHAELDWATARAGALARGAVRVSSVHGWNRGDRVSSTVVDGWAGPAARRGIRGVGRGGPQLRRPRAGWRCGRWRACGAARRLGRC